MAEPQYDKNGGIVNLIDDKPKKIEENQSNSGRTGYNFIERFILKHSRKTNYILDKQGRYKCRDPKASLVIAIGVTNLCSGRCFYCPREAIHSYGTGYMDFELYRKLIDWAAVNNVKAVGLSLFGEPLLHPRIIDMVDYAIEKGVPARISTNAIVMYKELAEKLIDRPISAFEMSMDGFTKEEYYRGKQVDKFDQAKENILYLLKLAKEKNSKASFNVHFVDIGNISFFNKFRYIKFWSKQLAGLKHATSFSYEPHNWAGFRDDIKDRMHFFDKLLTKWVIKKPCTDLKNLIVDFNGNVFVCGSNLHPRAVMGNINDQTIESILISPLREKYLSENEKGSFQGVECGICTVNSVLPLSYLKKKITNNFFSLLNKF